MDKFTYSNLLSGIIILFCFFSGVINLENKPPLWWDEGWNLSVARNWVERDHYGHLLNGESFSPGLASAFPVIAPIALSFNIFGLGIWQGRLPGVIFTLLNLVLIFYLAKRLFGLSSAKGTIGVLLLMSMSPWLHPILLGRQVLGEMPAIFYLLAGFTFFLLTLTKSAFFLIPAIIFWGIAINTKAQIPPFFWVSLLIPFAYGLIQHWWRQVVLMGLGGLGSLLAGQGFLLLQGIILEAHTIPASPLEGLYNLTAIVPDWGVRLIAVQNALAYTAPTLLGLTFFGWRFLCNFRAREKNADLEVLRLCLFALGGSWMAWYILMGMWWPRYLFPAAFIGSVFAGAVLSRITSHFNWRKTLQSASVIVIRRRINRTTLGAFVALVLTLYTIPITLAMLFLYYFSSGGQPALQVAEFLDTYLTSDALVETYDSELLFLSHKKIHYPPDQMSILLESRAELDANIKIDYDPLAEDPDYLVVGPFSRRWRLYESVLSPNDFKMIYDVPGYQVYERVRP